MSHMGEKVSAFSSKTKIFTHMNPFVLCEKKNSASFKKTGVYLWLFSQQTNVISFFLFLNSLLSPQSTL